LKNRISSATLADPPKLRFENTKPTLTNPNKLDLTRGFRVYS
jgi:hypothetical protein